MNGLALYPIPYRMASPRKMTVSVKSTGYKNPPEAFGETDDHLGVHDDKEL